jgi:cytochrome c
MSRHTLKHPAFVKCHTDRARLLRARSIALCVVAVALLSLCGCNRGEEDPVIMGIGGSPRRGAALITREACGACHLIPGIGNATGLVGPPLEHISRRTIIAGLLPNTPANLVKWLQSPQSVVPGNAMPNMGLSRKDAVDIAAYLYTIQ